MAPITHATFGNIFEKEPRMMALIYTRYAAYTQYVHTAFGLF